MANNCTAGWLRNVSYVRWPYGQLQLFSIRLRGLTPSPRRSTPVTFKATPRATYVRCGQHVTSCWWSSVCKQAWLCCWTSLSVCLSVSLLCHGFSTSTFTCVTCHYLSARLPHVYKTPRNRPAVQLLAFMRKHGLFCFIDLKKLVHWNHQTVCI